MLNDDREAVEKADAARAEVERTLLESEQRDRERLEEIQRGEGLSNPVTMSFNGEDLPGDPEIRNGRGE